MTITNFSTLGDRGASQKQKLPRASTVSSCNEFNDQVFIDFKFLTKNSPTRQVRPSSNQTFSQQMIVYVAVGRNISYQKKARVLEEIRVRNLLKEIKPPVNTLPIFEHPH